MILVKSLENKHTADAEITAFLSLVLLLVLALIGTVIEAARVNTAREYAERTLESALDSVFTEYGRTLYDDYHVFFLEGSNGEEYDTKLLDKLNDYMQYTLEPSRGLKMPGINSKISNVNLWNISTSETTLRNKVQATGYEGTIFANEAVEFMKYKSQSDVLKLLLNQLNLFDQTKETSKVVQEKLKAEASLGELNEIMIQFIGLIDGVSIHKKGIQYTSTGLLKTEQNFIKKLCPEDINSSNLSINNQLVWNSLKNQYINPVSLLSEIQNHIIRIQNNEKQILQLEESLRQLKQSYSSASKKEKKGIAEAMRSIQESISALNKDTQKSLAVIDFNKDRIVNTSSELIKKIDQAKELFPKLIEKQAAIIPDVNEFENVLSNGKEDMIPEVYDGMKEDLDYMKQYVGKENSDNVNDSMVFRIKEMKPILEQNRAILLSCDSLSGMAVTKNESDLQRIYKEADRLRPIWKQYQVKPLSFDYSSLKVNTAVKNPITSLNQLMKNGVMELVLADTQTVSKKSVPMPDNFYQLNVTPDNRPTTNPNMEQTLKKSDTEGFHNDITKEFDEFNHLGRNDADLSLDSLSQMLLLNEYIISHFKNYRNQEVKEVKEGTEAIKTIKAEETTKETVKVTTNKAALKGEPVLEKKSALDYETEYILAGKGTDKENLQEIIYKIILIRTVLNTIYVLSDHEKRNAAYATAAALVGYTCMEPLVRLTQTLILIGWSYEEALVDTGALLEGKSMPLLKDKKSFQIRYEELLLINKSQIQNKIKDLPDHSDNPLSLGYQDYLKLLLLSDEQKKKSFRSMDLIQENMRLRYRQDFNMEECIYGIRVKAQWSIPSKFIKFSFVNRVLNENTDAWKIRTIKEYSY
jgi:hypothetical protein